MLGSIIFELSGDNMSRKDVSLEHPMAADRQRAGKPRDVAEESRQFMNKLDEKKGQESLPAPKLPENSKFKSIKQLLYFGTITKVIEIDGFFFKLRSLTNQDVKDITKKMLMMSEQDRIIESNILHLAYSLTSINGLSISDAYSELLDRGGEGSDSDMAMEILGLLNASLVGKLIEEYFKVAAESKSLLENNKEEEAKDTVQNLKK